MRMVWEPSPMVATMIPAGITVMFKTPVTSLAVFSSPARATLPRKATGPSSVGVQVTCTCAVAPAEMAGPATEASTVFEALINCT